MYYLKQNSWVYWCVLFIVKSIVVTVRLFYFLQVGLNSLGTSLVHPAPLGHMPVSNTIDMNLWIHFTGCCIAPLPLLQHHVHSGWVSISKPGTVVRPQHTASDSIPAAHRFRQRSCSTPTSWSRWQKWDWRRSSRHVGSCLQSSLVSLHQSIFSVCAQIIAHDTSLE